MGKSPYSSAKLWRLSAMGIEFASAPIAMGLIGWLIDRAANTEPWWMLGLGLLGFIGGMYRLIRKANQAQNQTNHASRSSQ